MDTWGHLQYFHDGLFARRVNQYKQAVLEKTDGLVDNVALFLDGTKHYTCRPGRRRGGPAGENLQRVCYSGHKRRVCLSYQGGNAPDGIMITFCGPVEGRRHDITLLRISDILAHIRRSPILRQHSFRIYGDPAYVTNDIIITPFKGAVLTPEQSVFNTKMSKVRVSIEWEFGIVKRMFAFIDWAKGQKILLSPVAVLFKAAVFLTNVHTCVNRGNQISDFFQLDPPTLEEYLLDDQDD